MKFRTGGQTGVDRAVLDFCLENQVHVGGWCPARRKAEDGTIPTHYPLDELEGAGYGERTKANVRDSDGTMILHLGIISGGTQLTAECCRQLGRPCLSLNLRSVNKEAQVEEPAATLWSRRNGRMAKPQKHPSYPEKAATVL